MGFLSYENHCNVPQCRYSGCCCCSCCHFSRVRLFATPWTAAYRRALSGTPGLVMMWCSTASIMPLTTGVFRRPSTMRHGRPMKRTLSQSLWRVGVGKRASGLVGEGRKLIPRGPHLGRRVPSPLAGLRTPPSCSSASGSPAA